MNGPTLRDRAIATRERWLSEELRKQARGFRGDENVGADERREASEDIARHLRRSLATLRAMPVDVSDDAVRVAMGVA